MWPMNTNTLINRSQRATALHNKFTGPEMNIYPEIELEKIGSGKHYYLCHLHNYLHGIEDKFFHTG